MAVLTVAQKMPEFQGGTDSLVAYLKKHTKYPSEAREAGATGKAFVSFVVDTAGNVVMPKLIKSTGNKSLDEEALRVVSTMPKWQPARDSGKKVNVSLNLPVKFGGLSKAPAVENRLSPEEQRKHQAAMEEWEEGHRLERKYLFQKALDKFNKSLSIEPANKYALFDKAKMLMVLGQKEQACETWNKMIEANLRKEEAEDFVKQFCLVGNGVEAMARYYDKLRSNDFFEEGMKDVGNGRDEAAIRKFDSCLKYNPQHQKGLYNKGSMHFKLGQKRAACSSWTQLLAINPEDKQTEELLKKNCN